MKTTIISPQQEAMVGPTFIQLVRRVRTEFGVNAACGASNISLRIPERPSLNVAFLAQIIGAAMTSAITNLLETEMIKAIWDAKAFLGNDENCHSWIAYHKQQSSKGDSQSHRSYRPWSRKTD